MSMGWGLAAMAAMNYLSSQQQSKAAKESSQPLPTYYQEYQSPQQQEMYGYMNPMMQNMFSGNMPTMQGPTAGWYSGLDENVRAGIEEPYMRGMDMMRDQLGGTGMLGNQRAGMSGAAADVYGQYMQKAAPTMAQTGWNMMQPSMTANFNAQMFPYQTLPSMMPQTYSDLLVGHHPHIGPAGTPYEPPGQIPGNFIAPQDMGGDGFQGGDPIDRLGIYGDPAAGWGDYGIGNDNDVGMGPSTGRGGPDGGGGYGW